MKPGLLARATALLTGALLLAVGSGAAAHAAVSPMQVLLTRVGILPGDLARGYTVKVVPGGTSLADPTLDNCNFTFTSERQRSARRQITIVDPTGAELDAGSEAVLYKSVAAATKALVEWRASIARCRPLTWMKGDVPSDDVRIDSESNRTSRSLPLPDNADSNFLFRARGTKVSLRVLSISQRKGAVITTTFVYTAAKPDPSDVAALQFFAQRTGLRLAAAVKG